MRSTLPTAQSATATPTATPRPPREQEHEQRPGLLRLHVLQTFDLQLDGQSIPLPGVCERLLAYLAVIGPTHRNVLCGNLWPENTEKCARASLRTALWTLTHTCPDCLSVTRGSARLAPDVEVDLDRFRRLAWTLMGGDPQPAAYGTGEQLLRACTGAELLPGWYDDWLDDPRERVRLLRLHALEALCASLNDRGQHGLALQVALEVARMEPLRESAAAAVIATHLRAGNAVEARRFHASFSARLWDELGVTPSEELWAMLPPGAARRLGPPEGGRRAHAQRA
ncbi:DNA-binding transcriptional activator of the SARP family [Raineyella antarctica]|uniref:DNA-binding transcriptional activator of the SARP family n=1 Tax=Raineyella antarctica TaxID=1577474 RepID=A0A1G6HBP3_9ACTN|nr:BTAD domain-containing putative transcriptional regulator [Raineyella antarctica]SDB91727.1 DNA-binding transcriptional activator of the SARP family [Raineyella antarctica]